MRGSIHHAISVHSSSNSFFVSIAQNSQEVMLLSVFEDNRMVLDHVSAGLFARMTELFLPHISCKQSIIYA